MQHPNFLDRIFVKINPRYLYARQLSQTVARVSVGIIHKQPQIKPFWRVTDNVYLEKGSLLRFLGLVNNLKFASDIEPTSSLFEIVRPISSGNNPGHITSAGDMICITSFDRQYIYPASESALANPLPFRIDTRHL